MDIARRLYGENRQANGTLDPTLQAGNSFERYLILEKRQRVSVRIGYAVFAALCITLIWAMLTEAPRGSVAHLAQLHPQLPELAKIWLLFSTMTFVKVAFGQEADAADWFLATVPILGLAFSTFVIRITNEAQVSWVSVILMLMLCALIAERTASLGFLNQMREISRQTQLASIQENDSYKDKIIELNAHVERLENEAVILEDYDEAI